MTHPTRTDWKKPTDLALPDPDLKDIKLADGIHKVASTEYDVYQAALQDLRSYRNGYSFLSNDPDPQYRNPAAFRNYLIEYGKSLMSFSYANVPPEWDPVEAGTRIAKAVFDLMKDIPVNVNMPDSNDVWDAWLDGTGQNYGGW